MTLRTSSAIKRHFQHVLESHDEESARKRQRDVDFEGGGESASISDSEQLPDLTEDSNDASLENNDSMETAEDEGIPHPIYSQGRTVYEDEFYKVYVKAVAHTRRTRYSLSDHLFDLKIIPKESNVSPFLIDLEEIIEKGLIVVLERLQNVYYSSINQNQIYVTVVEENILHGLNSGNYSLNTPAKKIARWILGMLYNYLKSKQTLKLNKSFKMQIKVLSRRHMSDLQKKASFRRHVYH